MTLSGPWLRVALGIGLLEGVAVARYDVLMADTSPGNVLRALAAVAGVAGLHVAVWLVLHGVLRRGVRERLVVPLVFSLWAFSCVLGRTFLQDRTVRWGWWLILAGLVLAWLPVLRRLDGWRVVRTLAWSAAVTATVIAFQLGRLPDVSYTAGRQLAFWVVTVLVAALLLEACVRRPRTTATVVAVATLALGGLVLLPRSRPDRNVLWILVDTARRDHLAPYSGDARTPELAALAAGGVTFRDAVTVVPKTPASVASFLTGRYPTRHGVRSLYERLAPGQETLAESLGRSGWHTLALVNNAWLSAGRGFAQGFETFRGFYEVERPYGVFRYVGWVLAYDQLFRGRVQPFTGQTSSRRLTSEAIRELSRPRRKPFFAYVHYFEPHWPYFPPAELGREEGAPDASTSLVNFIRQTPIGRGRMIFRNPLPEEENEAARRLYRAEIRNTAAEIGRLLSWLEEAGLEDETLVVFTADHGHSLGEHDYYFHHGEFLYDASVRIPLSLRWPGRLPAGVEVGAQVRSIDVAPTIAGLVGVHPATDHDGRSLARYWQNPDAPSLPALLESDVKMFQDNSRRPIPGVLGKLRAIRDGRFKLIATPSPDGLRLELYDLENDPAELEDLASDPGHAEVRAALLDALFDALPEGERAQLGRIASQGAGDEAAPAVSEAELETLRSLGYIE